MAVKSLRGRSIPIADLRPAPWNTNVVPKRMLEKIRRSLRRFENLVVREIPGEPGYEVISGNHRLQLLREESIDKVPCVVVAATDAQARLLATALNRTRGTKDDPEAYRAALDAMLDEMSAREITELLPESEASIERIVARPLKGDPDVAFPPPRRPKSTRGTVYELGPHRLMCGDATDAYDVQRLLEGEEPQLLVTDPPYGVELDRSWSGGGKRVDPRRTATGLEHYMPKRETILGDTRADWSEAFELVPSLRVGYVWHAGIHAGEVADGLRRIGWEIAQQIIWDKGLFALSRSHYQWQHEAALYAYSTPASIPWYGPRHGNAWYARKKGVAAPWLGARDQSTVWTARSPKMAIQAAERAPEDDPVDHPTQKPAELYIRPIRNHLRKGEALYDCFAGGGTAVIAAEATGRVAYAMELDPSFCDVIRLRYAEYTGEREWAP